MPTEIRGFTVGRLRQAVRTVYARMIRPVKHRKTSYFNINMMYRRYLGLRKAHKSALKELATTYVELILAQKRVDMYMGRLKQWEMKNHPRNYATPSKRKH